MASTNSVFVSAQTCQELTTSLLQGEPALSTLRGAPSIMNMFMGTIYYESSFRIYYPIPYTSPQQYSSSQTQYGIPSGSGTIYTDFWYSPNVQNVVQLAATNPAYIPIQNNLQAALSAQGLTSVMGMYLYEGTRTYNYLPTKYQNLLKKYNSVLPVTSTTNLYQSVYTPVSGTNPPQPTTAAIINSLLGGLVILAWKYDIELGKGQSSYYALRNAIGDYVGKGVDKNGFTGADRIAQLYYPNGTPKAFSFDNRTIANISTTGSYTTPVAASYAADNQGTTVASTTSISDCTS